MNHQAVLLSDYISNFFPEFLNVIFWGNSAKLWLTAILIICVLNFALVFGKKLLLQHGSKVMRRLDTKWADTIQDVFSDTSWFIKVVAIYVGLGVLTWTEKAQTNIQRAFAFFTLIQIGIWGLHFINRALTRYIDEKIDDPSRATSMRVLGLLLKSCLIIILVLWGLDNWGVNIATLVTGLGIGGIAIALAVQSILGDLFASLTIVLDKPFVIGDAVVVGEFSGKVENIGLKTTRIRSLTGEQLVFSNTDLLQSRIRNYQRMDERRVLFNVGILYSTPHEKLQKVSEILRTAITSQALTRFDRAHFASFGDSSLNFEVVYFTLSNDYNVYMDTNERINQEIFKRFGDEGIGFAFPSRSVYVETVPAAVKA